MPRRSDVVISEKFICPSHSVQYEPVILYDENVIRFDMMEESLQHERIEFLQAAKSSNSVMLPIHLNMLSAVRYKDNFVEAGHFAAK